MRRVLLAALLVLSGVSLPAAAQDLLPPSFSGWNAPAAPTRIRPDALEQVAGGDAPVVREYGVLGVERREYSRGDATLRITLYRMHDSTAAYGAYTYSRTDRMLPADLAQFSCIGRERGLVVVGNVLIDVAGGNLQPVRADLRTLVAQITPRAEKTPYPTIGQHLPARGLVTNSERYLLGPLALNRLLPLGKGDWIGFADGAEAVLARYLIEGQQATLLLAAYPTPQAAARKFEELSRWLPLNPGEEPAAGQPALFARRSSSMLAIVAQSRSQAIANSLLQQVRYKSQVTWNEPGHKLTDPGIGQIVVGAILGTGVIMLFALVAGIGFGGVRLLVKYFFPGKVFDRPKQVEIIQLGLTSKPIEGKDFY